MTDTRSWLLLAVFVTTGVLLYLLAPVLTPFLVAALLAYISDPLVDRLETYKLSRTWAVLVVFIGLSLFAFILLLLLVSLIYELAGLFFRNSPAII